MIPGAGHGFLGDAAQRAIEKMSEYFSQHLTGATSPHVEDTTREYEIGDFGYWHAGPNLAIFYDDIYEQTIVDVIPLGHAQISEL